MHIKWTRPSRRHKIGRERARYVMATHIGWPELGTGAEGDDMIVWKGPDDRGLKLEIAAVRFPDHLMVIHVMPTALRGDKR